MRRKRAVWTDERLDDLPQRLDAGFDRIDRDIRELRVEMHQRFDHLEVTMRLFCWSMIAGPLAVIVLVTLGGS